MIQKLLLFYAISLSVLSLTPEASAQNAKADKVYMLMGIQGNSNCVIGPQLPHGSINPSPQTAKGRHSGYTPGQPIRGFGQLHVSGTGWGRYGQILLSPQVGFDPAEDCHDSPHSAETATPYYYAVMLDRYHIKAEVSPTRHCAVYRFTFPKSGEANLLVDIAHNIPQHIAPEIGGRFLGGHIAYDKSTGTLNGWGEYMGGFGSSDPYKVYFTLVPETRPDQVKIINKDKGPLYAQLLFPPGSTEITVRIGISMKSIENAKRFLADEVGTHSMEDVKAGAKALWEKTLSLIDIKGGTEDAQKQFYTALYHSFMMPRDRSGDNPNWNSEMPHIDDHYCVWDTWRTKYPLMVLLEESFVAKTINSFIDRFAHNGVCNPTFTSSLDWESKQGGDDVDNIIADAFAKGVRGFDHQKAYELIKSNAFNARSKDYIRLGWLPETGGKMSCSYNAEFAYNDFCTAGVASLMKDKTTAQILKQRSESWTKLFNPDLESKGFKGFMAPRKENGEWIDIDPSHVYGSWVNYFYEGNSWVYTLFTPHQSDRLIQLCGGKDEMIRRLTYGFDNHLIDLSNEPGFLAPFVFTHCNRADLTAKYVAEIRKNSFSLAKGYPDNEDSGAMGAWYVFTSIGLFPNAGQDLYYLLPPAFQDIELTMETGKKIRIKTIKDKPEDQYIQSVSINGKTLNRTWIRHHEIAEGATIIFKLTDKPGTGL